MDPEYFRLWLEEKSNTCVIILLTCISFNMRSISWMTLVFFVMFSNPCYIDIASITAVSSVWHIYHLIWNYWETYSLTTRSLVLVASNLVVFAIWKDALSTVIQDPLAINLSLHQPGNVYTKKDILAIKVVKPLF